MSVVVTRKFTEPSLLCCMLLALACGAKTTSSPPSGATQGGEAGSSAGTRGGEGAGGEATADKQPLLVMDFESDSASVSGGYWFGTGVVEQTLPIDSPSPERAGNALHLFGSGEEEGVDMYWHATFPLESVFGAVAFWAKADLSTGQKLFIAVGPAGPGYWPSISRGMPWPAAGVELTAEWQRFEIDFANLGLSMDNPVAGSEPFSALHLAVSPDTAYDFWLDDLELFPWGSESMGN